MFLGEILHKFNASAQYAAPLMADFGAGLHDKTSIRYIDTGTVHLLLTIGSSGQTFPIDTHSYPVSTHSRN